MVPKYSKTDQKTSMQARSSWYHESTLYLFRNTCIVLSSISEDKKDFTHYSYKKQKKIRFLAYINSMGLIGPRACVRNLELRVQSFFLQKRALGLKICGCKRWCPKDLRVFVPAAPVLMHERGRSQTTFWMKYILLFKVSDIPKAFLIKEIVFKRMISYA